MSFSCGLALSVEAATQNDAGGWDALMHEADVASTKHDLTATAGFYRQALVASQRFDPCDERRATTLESLGKVLLRSQQYSQSEDSFKQLLAMRLQCLPQNDGRVAVALQHLGEANIGLRRLDRAELFYRREIQILEKTFGPEDRVMALPLEKLASCLSMQGKLAEGKQVYSRVLAIRTSLMGPDSPGLVFTLNSYTEYCLRLGQFKDAEKTASQSLSIVETNFGNKSDKCVEPLLLLSHALMDAKNYAESEKLIEKALSIARPKLDEVTRNGCLSKQALIECCDNQDKFEKASAILIDLVHDWQKIDSGRNGLYQFIDQRGQKLLKLKRYKESRECYKLVMEVDKNMPFDVKASFLHGLAMNNICLGNYAEAEANYKHLMQLHEGRPETDLADRLIVLGYIYCNERKLAEAEDCFKKARPLLDARLEPMVEYNWYKCNILMLHLAGRTKEEKALEQRQKEFGKKHPEAVF